MTKDELITTAAEIPQVSKSAAEEYGNKRDRMVALINEYMLARDDIKELVGSVNIEMMKDNHANHGMFIESILKNYNSAVLVDTIMWVFKAYRSRDFHTNYWAAQLHAWMEVMKKTLKKESYEEIAPLYTWMTVNIPQFSALTDKE